MQAQWLAGLLVVALPIGLAITAIPSLLLGKGPVLADTDVRVFLGSMIVYGIIYTLSRRGQLGWAVALATLTGSGIIFTTVQLDFEVHKVYYLVLPIFFCCAWLPPRSAILYIGANMVGLLILSLSNPDAVLGHMLEPFSFVGMAATMSLFARWQIARIANYRQARLMESEARYRSLFEDSPIAIWEEDFSAVKAHLTHLRGTGVEDLRRYLETHPEEIRRCSDMVEIIDVNDAAVTQSGFTSRDELLQEVDKRLADVSLPGFIDELVGIAESKHKVQITLTTVHANREERHTIVTWQVAPGFEETLSRCLVSVQDITDVRRAQERLERGNRRYRALFEHTGTATCVFNTQHVIELCNQKMADLLGLPKEKVEGQAKWSDFVVAHDLERLLHYNKLREAGHSDAPSEYEFTLVNSQGRHIEVYLQIGLIDETGLRVASLVDISQLKQAQRDLRTSENRFRSIVAQSADGLMLADAQGQIIEWNRALEAISGAPYEAVVGKPSWEIMASLSAGGPQRGNHTEELKHKVHALQHSKMESGGSTVMEQRMRRADGTQRVAQITVFPIATDEGPMQGAIVRDITERIQAREALADSEQRLRTIVEGTDALLINTNPRGRITYVNAAAAAVLGYPQESLIGKLYLHYVHPEDRARVNAQYQAQVASAKATSSVEFRLVTANESIRWVHFVAHPIVRHGIVTEMVGFALDITTSKTMELELRQQERLAAVGQLAAGIAHDFRNLLSTILLYAQLCSSQPGIPGKVRHHLGVISEESHKAAELVEQILDFSSRSMIERRPVDLVALVQDRFRVFQRTIPEHCQLGLEVHDDGPGAYMVEADARRIEQALANLIVNARDAMPEGGALQVTLSTDREPPAYLQPSEGSERGEWVCLSVSDTGLGMTDAVQEHIFEPFFTTKEVGKGTGLGLPQVYGIVRQHGGYIDVESAPGKGSTFHIYLPRFRGETIDEAGRGCLETVEGGKETILLVEDETHLREAGLAALSSLGYRVMTAVDGQEALALCQAPRWPQGDMTQIDLVITDLIMPHMSGKQLVRELHKTRPDLKVLAITGYPLGDGDMEDLLHAGFEKVLQKPIDITQWANEIRLALCRE